MNRLPQPTAQDGPAQPQPAAQHQQQAQQQQAQGQKRSVSFPPSAKAALFHQQQRHSQSQSQSLGRLEPYLTSAATGTTTTTRRGDQRWLAQQELTVPVSRSAMAGAERGGGPEAQVLSTPQSQTRSRPRPPRLLYDPTTDHDLFSPYHVLIRQNIQVVQVVPQAEEPPSAQPGPEDGRKRWHRSSSLQRPFAGQVGLQCRFCAQQAMKQRQEQQQQQQQQQQHATAQAIDRKERLPMSLPSTHDQQPFSGKQQQQQKQPSSVELPPPTGDSGDSSTADPDSANSVSPTHSPLLKGVGGGTTRSTVAPTAGAAAAAATTNDLMNASTLSLSMSSLYLGSSFSSRTSSTSIPNLEASSSSFSFASSQQLLNLGASSSSLVSSTSNLSVTASTTPQAQGAATLDGDGSAAAGAAASGSAHVPLVIASAPLATTPSSSTTVSGTNQAPSQSPTTTTSDTSTTLSPTAPSESPTTTTSDTSTTLSPTAPALSDALPSPPSPPLEPLLLDSSSLAFSSSFLLWPRVEELPLGAVQFPRQLSHVAQAAQTIANSHWVDQCHAIPPAVRMELFNLRSTQNTGTLKTAWMDRMLALGIVEDVVEDDDDDDEPLSSLSLDPAAGTTTKRPRSRRRGLRYAHEHETIRRRQDELDDYDNDDQDHDAQQHNDDDDDEGEHQDLAYYPAHDFSSSSRSLSPPRPITLTSVWQSMTMDHWPPRLRGSSSSATGKELDLAPNPNRVMVETEENQFPAMPKASTEVAANASPTRQHGRTTTWQPSDPHQQLKIDQIPLLPLPGSPKRLKEFVLQQQQLQRRSREGRGGSHLEAESPSLSQQSPPKEVQRKPSPIPSKLQDHHQHSDEHDKQRHPSPNQQVESSSSSSVLSVDELTLLGDKTHPSTLEDVRRSSSSSSISIIISESDLGSGDDDMSSSSTGSSITSNVSSSHSPSHEASLESAVGTTEPDAEEDSW